MTMSPVNTTLGTHMKRRRIQLNLNQSEAARRASELRRQMSAPTAGAKQPGVGRTTWVNWEADKQIPEEFNFPLIEGVLRWAEGSVAAIRAGGEPTPLAAGAAVAPLSAGLPPDDDFVRELRKRRLSPGHLDVLIKEYWTEKAREQERLEDKFLRMARAAES